jgi:hypothetical protein
MAPYTVCCTAKVPIKVSIQPGLKFIYFGLVTNFSKGVEQIID